MLQVLLLNSVVPPQNKRSFSHIKLAKNYISCSLNSDKMATPCKD